MSCSLLIPIIMAATLTKLLSHCPGMKWTRPIGSWQCCSIQINAWPQAVRMPSKLLSTHGLLCSKTSSKMGKEGKRHLQVPVINALQRRLPLFLLIFLYKHTCMYADSKEWVRAVPFTVCTSLTQNCSLHFSNQLGAHCPSVMDSWMPWQL